MRVAIPIHSFEPGGVERVALRLAEHWRDAGHEPVVVLGRHRGACAEHAPALAYWSLRESLPTDRWETIWMIWSLFQFLLVEEVDVIFCPGNTYTVVCVAMRLLLGERCPPVLVKISNDLERRDLPRAAMPFYRYWLRLQGMCLDSFVAMAEPMAGELQRELAVAPARVRVIPDPALSHAELDALAGARRVRAGASGCRFLTIGRLVDQKNQLLLIEAFARHAWPEDSLVIAGDGPLRDRLAARIAALGLGNRVSLAGHVADPRPLYGEADVFVLSSDYEGVPAVILEALAAGLPIAATDCCASMAWLTGHGRFGTLVPTGDAEALGAAMNLARHLEPDHAAMQRLAARFTLENSSRLYLARFADLVESARRRRIKNLGTRMRVFDEGGV
ncbi:MAG: glycosyltransferase [Porphyrobacter sp.]|nr:glycosyltransferase [Porphyrobacter sp.]